jgi:hypothetical protein
VVPKKASPPEYFGKILAKFSHTAAVPGVLADRVPS